ncbi:hypothetical protein LguiB_027316 [Lonicera macranthoides]
MPQQHTIPLLKGICTKGSSLEWHKIAISIQRSFGDGTFSLYVALLFRNWYI